MSRYKIIQVLQTGIGKEPDIPIEDSKAVVEGKQFIIAIMIVERLGNQYQVQKRFESEQELQEAINNKFIIMEEINE